MAHTIKNRASAFGVTRLAAFLVSADSPYCDSALTTAKTLKLIAGRIMPVSQMTISTNRGMRPESTAVELDEESGGSKGFSNAVRSHNGEHVRRRP